MRTCVRRLLVLVALAAFSVPSPGIWARPLRKARRQVTCARRVRKAQAETAAAQACPPATGASGEAQMSPSQTVYDPFDDDDHRMKKGRRKRPADSVFSVIESHRVFRPASEVVAVIHERLEPRRPRPAAVEEPLPHFGSGPCHFIPRPREGTLPAFTSDLATA